MVMKAKILFLLIIGFLPAIGQPGLYLSAGIGQSKAYTDGTHMYQLTDVTFKPLLSGNMGVRFEWNFNDKIIPHAGIAVMMLGWNMEWGQNAFYHVGTTDHFRNFYLAFPIGVSIPVFKKAGVDLTWINGYNLFKRNFSWPLYYSHIWEMALQPGLFMKLEEWRFGMSYFLGLSDTFPHPLPDNYKISNLYNRALHFNVSYRLKTFGKK